MSQAIGKACHCGEYPKGTCFAARSDAAIRSFPARRRIPTPVTRSLARNDRKRDVGTPSPTTVHRTRPQGDDAHTSPRRTNAHFAAGHMGPALQGTPVMQDGTSGTPSPTTVHRTHPQGDDAHTSPRRTNAHFAAGHMGPALQGTPVMQDGTSRTPSPTTVHRTRPQGAMPTHRPAGQMRILRRDTWVPPYRVRRSCRTGRRDAVPYNGSPYPSAGGDAHIAPPIFVTEQAL